MSPTPSAHRPVRILLSADALDPLCPWSAPLARAAAVELASRGHDIWYHHARGESAHPWPTADGTAPPGIRLLEALSVPSEPGRRRRRAWHRSAGRTARDLEVAVDLDIVHHVGPDRLADQRSLPSVDGSALIVGPLRGANRVAPALQPYLSPQGDDRPVARTRLGPGAAGRTARHLRRTRGVLAASEETGRRLQALGLARVEVLAPAIVPDRTRPPAPPLRRAGDVLRVAWLGDGPGAPSPTLMLAVVDALDATLPVRVRLAGSEHHRLARLVERCRRPDRVELVGSLDPRDERKLLLDSDVLVTTALTEGGGAPVVRAMSLGLPVVALEQHEARTLLAGGGGALVPITTTDDVVRALAAVLSRLAARPRWRHRLGSSAWAGSIAFTTSAAVDQLEKLYGEAAGDGAWTDGTGRRRSGGLGWRS